MEHLYHQLQEYEKSDFYPYHMPGHKRRMVGQMPEQVMGMDITEIDGFDNLHDANGILKNLQEEAAKLFGAEESFYLVNGSTCGILSAISAALPVGGHLLLARDCHKSVYHGVYLRNLTTSYLYPEWVPGYDIHDAITPALVASALEQEPDIGAVLIVSPTYEGRIANIGEIARIVHEKGIPLIVDEAHGAHLGWSEEVSPNSCQLGADLVIHSVHKTLPSMTQTALLHVNGNLIKRDRLRRFLYIYQTSSPSYVLMASIDNALHLMKTQGKEYLHCFRDRYMAMLEQLSGCQWIEFLTPEKGIQDIGKLVISTKKYGLSGQKMYDILREEYHLQLEMAADSFCLAMFTVGDTREAYERMTEALLEIDERMQKGELLPDKEEFAKAESIKEDFREKDFADQSSPDRNGIKSHGLAIPLAIAWDTPMQKVSLKQAVGRYAGEFINLYPPGTPLLVPGEKLTELQYEKILSYLQQGLRVQGIERVDGIIYLQVLQDDISSQEG